MDTVTCIKPYATIFIWRGVATMKRRIIALVLIVLMLAAVVPQIALAATYIDSGYCGGSRNGKGVCWALNNRGTLTIYGKGYMADYNWLFGAPWRKHRDKIYAVTVDSGVYNVGDYSFNDCENITSVIISNDVSVIGKRAFRYCSSLTNLVLPNSVTHIGDDAFAYCDSLKNLTLGKNLKLIGDSAFYRCSALINVEFKGTKTQLNAIDIDRGNDSMTKANITCTAETTAKPSQKPTTPPIISQPKTSSTVTPTPKATKTPKPSQSNTGTVRLIDSGKCGNNLKYTLDSAGTLTISGKGEMTNWNLEFEGDKAAAPWNNYKSSIEKVVIESGVTTIGEDAFNRCTSLRSVSIANSVTKLNRRAFKLCSALTSITLPDSVTHIGYDAFMDCSNLSSIKLGKGVTKIMDSAFYRCSSLTSLVMPNTVNAVGNCVFTDCVSLKSVTLSDNLYDLGNCMFENCYNLKTVYIAAHTKFFGHETFSGCDSLEDINFGGSEKDWGKIQIYKTSTRAEDSNPIELRRLSSIIPYSATINFSYRK